MSGYNVENFLAHHGIEGQKWGKQNGPPYPLSRQQLSEAEKKKTGLSESAKEKYGLNKKNKAPKADVKKQEQAPKEPPKAAITKSEAAQYPTRLASAQNVYANRSQYTNQELQAYINRVNLESQVADLARKEYEASHPVKMFIKKKANQALDTAVNNAVNYGQNELKKAIKEAINPDDFTGPSLSDIKSNPGKYSNNQINDALKRRNLMERVDEAYGSNKSSNSGSNNNYNYTVHETKSYNYTRPEKELYTYRYKK